jgi:hypothetical protein
MYYRIQSKILRLIIVFSGFLCEHQQPPLVRLKEIVRRETKGSTLVFGMKKKI